VPQAACSILEGILERTVRVRHFVRCATNSKNGVQSPGGTTCFQHERVFVLITSSLNFYWLRVHLVLAAAPAFSELKPAVLVLVVQFEQCSSDTTHYCRLSTTSTVKYPLLRM
jgi:hypothetical protein